jgi:alpha-D-xyloside xylohydrolase
LSRYHGATARDPWLFGEDALRIFREYARLRSRLVPYLYSYAWDAAETGLPLMRPMVLEFPEDPAAYAFDLQYCLGRELLVSPVVSPDGWVTTYLPRGRWRDWWSGAVCEGPTTLRRQVPLSELPLYLREDSLLPLGPVRNFVAERPIDPLTVEAFITREAEFQLRSDDRRLVLRCQRDGRNFVFDASEAPCTYLVRFHQCETPARVHADGQPLRRLGPAELTEAGAGWSVEHGTVVVKGRVRQMRLEC